MILLGVKTMLTKAIQLIKNKEYNNAQTLLLELLQKNPHDAEANFYCASTYDAIGLEREAIPYYEKAIANGIDGEYLQQTYIQLGSSYRALGEYEKAKQIFEKGIEQFPDNLALQTFLAMTLYNLREDKKAMTILLHVVVKSSSDSWIEKYRNALQFYSEHLDETW